MKHRDWILCSGGLWFVVGLFLMYKGLRLIGEGQMDPNSFSVQMRETSSQVGNMMIFLALVIGFFKGRVVFSKTVQRVVSRILSLPLPIRFSQVYTKSYWILISCMMMLGMVFRFLPISVDVRGFIDVAVGSALINGSMLYFRASRLASA